MKMGLREDLERFKQVGEEKRQDLKKFIAQGNIQAGDDIKVPIKIIELPSFEYSRQDAGGVSQGEGEVGDPVEQPGEEGKEPGEPGEEGEEHGHYQMSPEEFAKELDEELGLDLDPKGKQIKEEKEGDLVDLVRSGPDSTLDFERMYKKGLKRKMAMYFDEEYMHEVLKVKGFGPDKAFKWARENNIPVSKSWIRREYEKIPSEQKTKYQSVSDIDKTQKNRPNSQEIKNIPLRDEDKRHKYPEIHKEYEKNAVIVMIRDVSGSMRQHKRELVEHIFTPLDWYLTGKYDEAEFIYIAHDVDAWEVDKTRFFGIKSGGGTRISSAYELTQEILDRDYPWNEWNRYVFAAGDGENLSKDSEENVVPLIREIDANLHAYLEVEDPDGLTFGGNHGDIITEKCGDLDNVVVTHADNKEDSIKCIKDILSTEGDG